MVKQNRLDMVRDYQNTVNHVRKKIPDNYNQIALVDELMNPDIDFYISISNRSDGKSFNYVSFFIYLAMKLDIKFTLISRHYTLRDAYRDFIEKIIDENPLFKSKRVTFRSARDYLAIIYQDKEIGVITDLNSATDLKYHSNFLKDFPIIIYDEFLALEDDYLSDEWDKLKTIYESIDRKHGNVDYIGFPKIFLLGNAVNFSSPILSNLNIYNLLQKHKMNTSRLYNNIYLEMRRNDYVNEKRNTRAFNSNEDAMTTGEFEFNEYNLADENLRNHINQNGDFFYIKTDDKYIKVMYNVTTFMTNIIVVPYTKQYEFCTKIRDIDNHVTYLRDDMFYKENMERYYYNPSNLHFDNAYSKNYVVDNDNYLYLDMNKIIKFHIKNEMIKNTSEFERKEKQFEDNYIENTKKYLMRQYEL
ncbi:terminase [Staphylococcus phage vB_SauP_EBHT]|uniref:Encapsidation protein n=1 Tax=Staphylococcus phage Portland TaxID=2650876 RepID=A0A7L8ZJL4_9CAUD|nr:terminase [Staphylococcus phage vB_SauP_EBHT]QOI69184.1 putative encapsidation protein [Staphylococcus phage Portland]